MKETDSIRMEIHIAGERLLLNVPFLKQNAVRDAEARVSSLFESWQNMFKGKSPRQVLAMVAYQFSYQYGELLAETDLAVQRAESAAEKLDALLGGKVPGEPLPSSTGRPVNLGIREEADDNEAAGDDAAADDAAADEAAADEDESNHHTSF